MPEHGEVHAFVFKLEVQTPRASGNRIINPCLVKLVDNAVSIQVSIFESTHTGVLLTAGKYFLTALEQAIYYIAYDRAVRLTGLDEVLGCGMHITTGGCFRQISNAATEEVKVTLDIVIETVF